MIALTLWLFGSVALASMVMIFAWGRATTRLYHEESGPFLDLRWCRPLVIAASMTIHGVGMSIGTSYRAWDMLHGLNTPGSTAMILIANMVMLIASKVGFIWGVAIDPDRRYVRWPWWAFMYAMIIWGLFVWCWAIGGIDLRGMGI